MPFKINSNFQTDHCPFRKEEPTFLQKQTNFFIKKPYAKLKDLSSSPFAIALMPLLKAAQKIEYIGNLFFETFYPNKTLPEFLKVIKDSYSSSIESFATNAGKVKYVLSFIKLFSLPEKIKKTYVSKVKSKKSGIQNKIDMANMKILALFSNIFSVPGTLCKFSGLFTKTPSHFKNISEISSVFALVFSSIGIYSKSQNRYTTSQLLIKLKTAHYRAYIQSSMTPEKLNQVGPIKEIPFDLLKARVKRLQNKLNPEGKPAVYDKNLTTANLAVMKKLSRLVEKDKKLLRKQFNIETKIKPDEGIELSSIDKKKTALSSDKVGTRNLFLSKVFSKHVIQNPHILAGVVKNLELKLEDKIIADKFALVIKVIDLIPSTLSSVVAVSSFCLPSLALGVTLTPIASAISGLVSLATFTNIIYCHYRERSFINAMDQLTS